MKRILCRSMAALILAAPWSAHATPVPVGYEIGSYGPVGGYSASWLHDANHCGGPGPDSGETLWKCSQDGSKAAISGTIFGTLGSGIFSIDGGTLTIAGMGSVAVTGGSLSGPFVAGAYGAPSDLLWHLVTDVGTFYAESMSMGASGPNQFSADEFVIWAQTEDAYAGCSGPDCQRWGIDLYGKRIPVPEPGALTLFGLGLVVMIAIMRRRRRVLCHEP